MNIISRRGSDYKIIPSEFKTNIRIRILILFFQYTLRYVEEKKENGEIISIARRLYGGKNENTYDDLMILFSFMEDEYRLQRGILCNKVEELSRIVQFINEDQWMNIIRSSYFIDIKQEVHSLFNSFSRDSFMSTCTTHNSIMEVAHFILEINKDETYLDLFCGFFLSSIISPARKNIGAEIDEDIISLAYMYHIMDNYDFDSKRFEIKRCDLYRTDSFITADKVFADGPSEGPNSLGYNSLDNLAITIESVGLGGKGVCSVFERDALSAKRNGLKESIIRSKSIEAIIAINSKDDRTIVTRYLVVINKKNKNDRILFIDSRNDISKDANRYKLTDTYRYKKEIKGYSRFVNVEEIEANNFSLNISDYVRVTQEYRDVEQINRELADLYKELFEKLKNNLDK